ncbi:MAG: N-6 DNA methylase [Spirochaetaceae bacterium]|jgi:hypothetical protein|nr:N-6 DNA methylase [Spirochaetaceae bacterium]
MIEKYFIKWAAPARDDLDEIIEYIAQTNIIYAVQVLDKIEAAVMKSSLRITKNGMCLAKYTRLFCGVCKVPETPGNYTPRAVTDFMALMIAPVLGEKIADFVCGTGGFLISALAILEPQVKTTAQREQYVNSVYGVEKKALPYLLCATNLLLHDIDCPDVMHGNSLEKNVKEYGEKEKFDIILMNPPYGGSEKDAIKKNFPPELRSSETADLFLSVIMYRLKPNGRAAVVIPDGFL